MEINNNTNEIVCMKRDIRSHKFYEKYPNLLFGIIILIWGLLFFLSLFSDNVIPYWVFLFIAIAIISICYIKNNEKTNLTKSSAFIERDGIIYYIRLGYTLDHQQTGVPFGFKKNSDCSRKHEKDKTYSRN